MSSQQPQSPQPDIEKYRKTVHNVALAALVTCPILALLPPRKLDIYTIGLIATTGYSANYLVRERSGRSIWQTVTRQPAAFPASRMEQSVVGEIQKEGRVGHEYQSGWKAERQKEIKEDVEEGKDFSDMIIDQIWEVWNQGKGKKEDED
ncbi:hypothetical protein CBER1_03553 [Cercospora berteroae]|uniref:Uncharacterized protein n=1 Tax=Cercospora berteroae TaxID=357750 RepID=A0A2S6CFV3_9PEZI|nr:hypothetical protein CBER1_03553 [Cercospora berteroae]